MLCCLCIFIVDMSITMKEEDAVLVQLVGKYKESENCPDTHRNIEWPVG